MRVRNLISNTVSLLQRSWLSRTLVGGTTRDLDLECGYPTEISINLYKKAYERNDIARRIISLYPEDCWGVEPEVYEVDESTVTEFEQSWNDLTERLHIYSYMGRVDELSGIGRYGVLLLGLGDGKSLSEPVTPKKGMSLLYLRALDEEFVKISEVERDTTNPRFGHPIFYEIVLNVGENQTMKKQVHWSRIIHVADNRTTSEIFGTPRLKVVYNRLLDLWKVAGGSAEMFWKGGFPGLSLEVPPEIAAEADFDVEATKEEIEAYMNGLKRYLATVGMSAKMLSPQVADPRPHVESQLRLIAAALGVPWRIFVGSEMGQLASEKDWERWNQRLKRRQKTYITPFILRPFIDRLIQLGVLPTPKQPYKIAWPDLTTMSESDLANVAVKKADAITKYITGAGDSLVPPFYFLTTVMGMSESEAETILKELESQMGPEGEEKIPEEVEKEGEIEE